MANILNAMPEVLNLFGYSFFFYSKEHEPIHIHVEGEEGLVVYDLIDGEFVLRKEKGKVKTSSKKKIVKALKEHKDLIIEVWKEHFGEDDK